tara:strand:+ start:3482 stop:5347 length:1866 start_codon:yes stop_codon:yes gene_type:complete
MSVIKKLSTYFAAGQAGLVLTSEEPEECLQELATAARASQATDEPWDLMFWDAVDGLTDAYENDISVGGDAEVDPDIAALGLGGLSGQPQMIGLHDALQQVLACAKDRKYRDEMDESTAEDGVQRVICVRNWDRHLAPNGASGAIDANLLMLAQKLIRVGQGTGVTLLMQTSDCYKSPPELKVHCEYVKHDAPDSEEVSNIALELGIEEDKINDELLQATAGLSRAKVAQYLAETVSESGFADPTAVFKKKAVHMAKDNHLDIFHPAFIEKFACYPRPESGKYAKALGFTLLKQEHHYQNPAAIKEGEVRCRVSYVLDDVKQTEWLESMPLVEFEHLFRPDKNPFSFDSVVGHSHTKETVRQLYRPNLPDRCPRQMLTLVGPPGTGKSLMHKCIAGELELPMASLKMEEVMDQYVGNSEQYLMQGLNAAIATGGFLAIDEIEQVIPANQSSSEGNGSGVERRMSGQIKTFLNDQDSMFIIAGANSIKDIHPAMVRSLRGKLMWAGWPDREAKDEAWRMYTRKHELAEQKLPKDDWWTPADIAACCVEAEVMECSIFEAAESIVPTYFSRQDDMEALMADVEREQIPDSATGKKFVHPRKNKKSSAPKKVTRRVKPAKKENE